jgi:alpha-methylacyl-CoA racemase
MVDAAPYLATMVRAMYSHRMWTDQRAANLFDGGAPHYRCYRCSDGRFVAVGALEPKFWAVLLDTLGVNPASTPSPYDQANWPELSELLGEIFAGRTRDEWAASFEPLDACVAPVLTLAEAPRHRHNAARGSYLEVAGALVAAPTPRFGGSAAEPAAPPPTPGADTDDLLAELGYPAEQVARLRARRVLG